MIETLRGLGTHDLRHLAAALRAGRLSFPLTAFGLRGVCCSGDDAALAAELSALAGQGMSAAHLALLVETMAAEREAARPEGGDLVDLVWSGPEAPGTASRDTGVVVRELFRSARSEVLLAGFAIYKGKSIFATLAERMETVPELRVRMFLEIHKGFHDTTLPGELTQRFAHKFKAEDWPQGKRLPEVYYDPRSLEPVKEKRSVLHAKCIVVDRAKAFVSSANFTEAAQARNIEVGVLISSPDFAQHLASHFDQLVSCGALQPLGMES